MQEKGGGDGGWALENEVILFDHRHSDLISKDEAIVLLAIGARGVGARAILSSELEKEAGV